MNKILLLRVVHGIFALYFLLCLIYLYYAAIFLKLDVFLLIAIISLGIEGFMVFILNKGDCPFIYIQRRIGDDIPFFNLFLPAQLANQAIPILVKLTWIGIALLIIRTTLINVK